MHYVLSSQLNNYVLITGMRTYLSYDTPPPILSTYLSRHTYLSNKFKNYSDTPTPVENMGIICLCRGIDSVCPDSLVRNFDRSVQT